MKCCFNLNLIFVAHHMWVLQLYPCNGDSTDTKWPPNVGGSLSEFNLKTLVHWYRYSMFLLRQPALTSCYSDKLCLNLNMLIQLAPANGTTTDGRSLLLFLEPNHCFWQISLTDYVTCCSNFSFLSKNQIHYAYLFIKCLHSPHSSTTDESRYSQTFTEISFLLLPGLGPTGFEPKQAGEDRKLTGLHWLSLLATMQMHR